MRQFFFVAIFALLVSSVVPHIVFAQTGGATGSWTSQPPSGGPTGVQSGPGGGNNPVQPGPGGGVVVTSVSLVNPLNGVNCTSTNGDCLMAFLNNILAFVIRIGTIVVILMLVFVGFKFVMARGEPGELSKAKSMLLWTVVGALVLLGAQAISLGILATVQSLSG